MKGVSGLVLLLFAFPFQEHSQSTDSLAYYDQANDYQSLRTAVSKVEIPDTRTAYYLARSFNQDDVDFALQQTDSLLNSSLFEQSSVWKERLVAHRVSLLRKKGNFNEVIATGAPLHARFADAVSRFDLAHNISISYRRINAYDSALRWGLPLIDQAEELGDAHRSHRAIQNMANLYSALKEYPRALALEKDLIVVADRMDNADLRVLDRCNLGSSFLNLSMADSARMYFQESLALAKSLGISNRLPLILYNMSSLEYREDQYPAAVALLTEAIESAALNNKPIILTRSRYLLALCYLEQGQLNLVDEQIVQGLADASRYGSRQDRAYFLQLRADVADRTGRYPAAIADLQALRVLEDSIMNEERMETIEELQTKYETEKKERQIESLEQEQTIAALRIRQQNALMIGGGALALVLALVGYFIYRNRTLRLAQQRLQTEQQLLRSQMNPHFLFNALGAIHSFVFKGQKREAADYLSSFGELTRDILDQSAQEWITLRKEIDTLEKYMQIQQLRFPHVQCDVQLDPNMDADNLLLPPMLLQPFVENAFEHGLKGQSSGAIQLSFSAQEDQLTIEIEDDGQGLAVSESAHDSKAIGITQDRLRLLYGKDHFKLSLNNLKNNNGVLVSIVLPLKEAL